MKRVSLMLLAGLLAVHVVRASDDQQGIPSEVEDSAVTEQESTSDEPADAQFLAFLEYLGSWEESDEEWQAFHPDEGLSEIRLPAPRERSSRGQAEGDEDRWDDNGRS